MKNLRLLTTPWIVGSNNMAGFDFSQFRTMLSVIRRGEEHDNVETDKLFGSSTRNMSPVAKRVLMGVLLLVLCLALFLAGSMTAKSSLSMTQMFFVMVAMLVVIVVLVGFYQAVNMLYFAKDMSFYLALPIHPFTIVAAKMVYFVLSQVAINVVVLAFGVGFLAGRGAEALDFVSLVLAFIPCVITTSLVLIIVVIPVMRFSRIAADKDKFARVFGSLTTIVSLAIAAAVSLNSRSAASSMMTSMTDMVGNGVVSVVLTFVCAPTLLVSQAFSGNVLALLGMYALAALYVVVMGLFSKWWYFEGVCGMQGGAGKKSRKHYSEKEIEGAVKQRGQFKAFLSQDIATLIRVPAFFQQFVVSMLLEPIAIAAICLVGNVTNNGGIFGSLDEIVTTSSIDANTHLALLGIILLVGFLSCFPSYLNAFALGRDGNDFFFLRAMPVDIKQYVTAKFASGYFVARVPIFVLLLVILVVLGTPVDMVVLGVLAFALPLTAVDLAMFGIGSRKPRLAWENEAQLFKQSDLYLQIFISVILGVFAFALPGVIMVVCALFGISGYVGAVALLVVGLAECIGAAAFAFTFASSNMERVQP